MVTAQDAPKKADEDSVSLYKRKLREKKLQLGRPVSPELEFPDSLDEGVSFLHQTPGRTVTLHPDGIVKKSGRGLFLGEAEAQRFVASHGLPVPHVHGTETTSDGKKHISMDYIEGDTLSKVWLSLSEDQKIDIARQLRDILEAMRSIEPPEGTQIGAHSGGQIRDLRVYDTYTAPSCQDEMEFNDYLITGLIPKTPWALRSALSRRLRTNHRVVFTHGDLAPRNIIVKDGKIVSLLDWEAAGWYPEYWEYIKFFQRIGTDVWDWWQYSEDIFSEAYDDELVDYVALSKWQWP